MYNSLMQINLQEWKYYFLYHSYNSDLDYRRQQTSDQMKGHWVNSHCKLKQNERIQLESLQTNAQLNNVSLSYETDKKLMSS